VGLLLGLLPCHPVELRGAVHVGDGGGQLDVLTAVGAGVA